MAQGLLPEPYGSFPETLVVAAGLPLISSASMAATWRRCFDLVLT
jgi:hypothetical protein